MADAFNEFIWPRRKIVFIGLILIIISRMASLVLPGASKYLMDEVIVKKDKQLLIFGPGTCIIH